MKPRFLAAYIVLFVSLSTGCGDRAADPTRVETKADPAPADAAAAGTESASSGGEEAAAKTREQKIQRELDEIASKPLRLSADRGVPKTTIAANGDFTIGDETIPIDASQRTRLLAYRTQLLTVVQAGAELSSRTTGVVTEKIGAALGKVFEDEKTSGNAGAELKAEVKTLDALSSRICEAMPALLREQQALVAVLPKFKPYAALTQADVDACRGSNFTNRTSADKVGYAVGTAVGNPFRGGMVAGYMATELDQAEKMANNDTAKTAEAKTTEANAAQTTATPAPPAPTK